MKSSSMVLFFNGTVSNFQLPDKETVIKMLHDGLLDEHDKLFVDSVGQLKKESWSLWFANIFGLANQWIQGDTFRRLMSELRTANPRNPLELSFVGLTEGAALLLDWVNGDLVAKIRQSLPDSHRDTPIIIKGIYLIDMACDEPMPFYTRWFGIKPPRLDLQKPPAPTYHLMGLHQSSNDVLVHIDQESQNTDPCNEIYEWANRTQLGYSPQACQLLLDIMAKNSLSFSPDSLKLGSSFPHCAGELRMRTPGVLKGRRASLESIMISERVYDNRASIPQSLLPLDSTNVIDSHCQINFHNPRLNGLDTMGASILHQFRSGFGVSLGRIPAPAPYSASSLDSTLPGSNWGSRRPSQ